MADIPEILKKVQAALFFDPDTTISLIRDMEKWSQQPHIKNLDPVESKKAFDVWSTQWQIARYGKTIPEMLKDIEEEEKEAEKELASELAKESEKESEEE